MLATSCFCRRTGCAQDTFPVGNAQVGNGGFAHWPKPDANSRPQIPAGAGGTAAVVRLAAAAEGGACAVNKPEEAARNIMLQESKFRRAGAWEHGLSQ